MQADGKSTATRPELSIARARGVTSRTPRSRKMAEIAAVADFTPAVHAPEDIAARPPPQGAPGPAARDRWVSASVTESIEDMIAAAFGEADRRDLNAWPKLYHSASLEPWQIDYLYSENVCVPWWGPG